MTMMKTITFNLLPAIFLWLGSCCVANGQANGDQITDGGQIIQDGKTTTGQFQPVTVDPSKTCDVSLQFSVNLAGKSVVVQPLDGGTLQIGNSAIDQNGVLSFSFQVTDQPGVYRVIIVDPTADVSSPNIVGTVQFDVPNPAQ